MPVFSRAALFAAVVMGSAPSAFGEEDPADPCSIGFAGQMRERYPECVAGCEASCPAVGVAAGAYFQDGEAGVRQAVCAAKDSFACFVAPGHVDKCAELLEKAAENGFAFPKTAEELEQQCSTPAGESASPKEASPDATMEAQVATAGMCSSYRRLAPSCIRACSSSCRAVDAAAGAWAHGGRRGGRASVCKNPGAFECFLRHTNECRPLVSRAAGYGFPSSLVALRSMCGRGKELADEASPETATTAEADACSSGFLGSLRGEHSACIDGCSSSCAVANAAIDAYHAEGQPAALEIACSDREKFECFLQGEACKPLFATAATRGIHFPTTVAELEAECAASKVLLP